MPAKLTAADYHNIAKGKGFKWLGEFVLTAHDKTQWQCPLGHIWEAKYNHIKNGRGCPYCSGKARKTPENYQQLALSRNLKWCGEMPSNNHTPTQWTCENGHIFSTDYHHLAKVRGCPHCSDTARKTATDYHKLASYRGFKWLGNDTTRVLNKTTWECASGHVWEARFADINNGSGCPLCLDYVNGYRVSKPQRAIHAIVGGVMNYRAGRYSIDIAIEPHSLFRVAIEYDCYYWHSLKPNHDAKRDKWLLAHGWSILRIRSGVLIPDLELLNAAIYRLQNGERYLEITLSDWFG